MADEPTHVLLDLDGTLTDPAVGITRCIAHALTELGYPVPSPAELMAWIGPPLQASFAGLFGVEAVIADVTLVSRAVALYRERFSQTGIYENAVYDGIPEALAELAGRGHRLYVATSKPAGFAEEIVRHFGLAAFFAGVYGSEMGGERSDKGELIAHLLANEGLSPAAAVMVGDRRHDITGGRRNGVRATVGVVWGYGGEQELRDAGADALCHAPADLADAVRGLPAASVPDSHPSPDSHPAR